jgi:hypothetical protein
MLRVATDTPVVLEPERRGSHALASAQGSSWWEGASGQAAARPVIDVHFERLRVDLLRAADPTKP